MTPRQKLKALHQFQAWRRGGEGVQPSPKEAPKLRLFVWTGFCPDYTSGLAFAIAKDETDARKQIEKERGYTVYTWGDLTIYPLTKRIARSVFGGG